MNLLVVGELFNVIDILCLKTGNSFDLSKVEKLPTGDWCVLTFLASLQAISGELRIS